MISLPSRSNAFPTASSNLIRPRNREIAIRPTGMITFGLTIASSRARNGAHNRRSAPVGTRSPRVPFLPGKHLVMAVMYCVVRNSSSSNPTCASHENSRLPAGPSNGRPVLTSFAPGACPTTMIWAVAMPEKIARGVTG